MSHRELMFKFLRREVNDYLFFMHIRQAFSTMNISERLTTDIMANLSRNPVPTSQEVISYQTNCNRIRIYPQLRKALMNITNVHESRDINRVIIPHFDIELKILGPDLQIQASMQACHVTLTVPQQLNREVHQRILNCSNHKLLLFITAIRYHREYIRHNKQLSMRGFWSSNTDIVDLLNTCRGKKYITLDLGDDLAVDSL